MTDTAPYSPACLDLVRQPFTVDARSRLYVAGGSQPVELRPDQLTITYDGRRAPLVDARLVAAWPSKATRGLMDPAQGLVLALDAGYRLPGGGIDSQPMAELQVQNVETDYLARTVNLTAVSDEILVIGRPFSTVATIGAAGIGKVDVIKSQVQACVGSVTWSVDPKVDTGATFSTAQASKAGDDRWEALYDWTESLGAKLYHDGTTWHITKPPSKPGESRTLLATGPSGVITDLQVTDTRGGDFATEILLQYVSRSGSTTTTTTILATTDLEPVLRKVVTRRRPVENGRAVARHILARALRRTHQVSIEASAHFWLRPGDTVTVDFPDAGHDRVLVDTVSFDVLKGTMRLVGRSPGSALTATPSIALYDETTT